MSNDNIYVKRVARYIRVALFPFLVVSVIGLLLTLIMHLSIWAGLPLSKYTLKLFIGIPVVWLPTVLVFQLLTRGSALEDSWKVCMRECPVWMKYMSWVFFIYAFISFGFMLFGMYTDIKSGGSGGGLPKFVSLGSSGFCLVFYSTAMSSLYSARKILERKSTKNV